jgi:hypothetical protein
VSPTPPHHTTPRYCSPCRTTLADCSTVNSTVASMGGEIGVQSMPRRYFTPSLYSHPNRVREHTSLPTFSLYTPTVPSLFLFRVHVSPLCLLLPHGHAATPAEDSEASGTSPMESFAHLQASNVALLKSNDALTKLQSPYWILFGSIQRFLSQLVKLDGSLDYSFFIQLHLTVRTLY